MMVKLSELFNSIHHDFGLPAQNVAPYFKDTETAMPKEILCEKSIFPGDNSNTDISVYYTAEELSGLNASLQSSILDIHDVNIHGLWLEYDNQNQFSNKDVPNIWIRSATPRTFHDFFINTIQYIPSLKNYQEEFQKTLEYIAAKQKTINELGFMLSRQEPDIRIHEMFPSKIEATRFLEVNQEELGSTLYNYFYQLSQHPYIVLGTNISTNTLSNFNIEVCFKNNYTLSDIGLTQIPENMKTIIAAMPKSGTPSIFYSELRLHCSHLKYIISQKTIQQVKLYYGYKRNYPDIPTKARTSFQ